MAEETVISIEKQIDNYFQRAEIALENGDFQSADAFCEQILNLEPKKAEAYLYKLLASLGLKNKEELKTCLTDYENNYNYINACRFGDETLKAYFEACKENAQTLLRERRLDAFYRNAIDALSKAQTEAEYMAAAEAFKSINGYKDADALYKNCLMGIENLRKEAIYLNAVTGMRNVRVIDDYLNIAESLKPILDYKNSEDLYKACLTYAENAKKEVAYNNALTAMRNVKTADDYLNIAENFKAISGYKNAEELYNTCLSYAERSKKDTVYNRAVFTMKNVKAPDDCLKAAEEFKEIMDYRDSEALYKACLKAYDDAGKAVVYNAALTAMRNVKAPDDYLKIAETLKPILDYKNTEEVYKTCLEYADRARKDDIYNGAVSLMKTAKTPEDYMKVALALKPIIGYKNAKELCTNCLNMADRANKDEIFASAGAALAEGTLESVDRAYTLYLSLKDWRNSGKLAVKAHKELEKLKKQASKNQKKA